MSKVTYLKRDLVQSKRYAEYRDILQALLKDDKAYTSKEVDSIIKNFLKKEVK